MFRFLDVFYNAMKASFKRASRATKGEKTVEDLHSDACVAALEIAKQRGKEIDFSDPQDQNLIMGAVHMRNVVRPEKNVRYAVRIDAEVETDEGERNYWANRLKATASSDPLELLVLAEEMHELDAARASTIESTTAPSYSAYSAYLIALFNFDGDSKDLSLHLAISTSAFRSRMGVAKESVERQPSIFDCIEKIAASFMPLGGRKYIIKSEEVHSGTQLSWEFST